MNLLNLNNIIIDGFDQACPLYTYTYSAPFISGAAYIWTVTNGDIIGSPNNRQVQLKLSQNSSNQTTLNLRITNICSGSITTYKTITHGDPPPPAQQCLSQKNTFLSESEFKEKVTLTEWGEMKIFPNPASTEATIIAPTKGNFILGIFNILGQSMYEESIEIHNKRTIDVNAFPDGIYYVKLESKTRTFTKKLILKK